MKNSRGITLVALIVTIIILLILAGVSIMQITKSGLFDKGKLAKEKSENAQDLQEEILADYKNKIDNYKNIGTRNNSTEILEKLQETEDKVVFEYTGEVQEFVASSDWYYKIECWGA